MITINDYLEAFIAILQAMIPIIGFVVCIFSMFVALIIALGLPISLILKVVDNVTKKE